MNKINAFIILCLLTLPFTSHSKEVAGVTIPDSITLEDKATLVLNGAGIRSKFFFKIYVGSLYLSDKTTDIESVLNDKGAKRVSMHMLYDELEKEKITSAWLDGFEDNNTKDQFNSLKERLAQFNQLFPDLKKGDIIHMDYIPESGTRLTINDEVKGTIEGLDFNIALLKVWLGDSPADSDLKEGLMGQ